MPIPQVETFESDITEEIKQKQGSVTDTLAAHSSAPPKTPDQMVIRLIVLLIIFLLLATIGAVYFYISNRPGTTPVTEQIKPLPVKKTVAVTKILPKTGITLEHFVTTTTKEPSGYVLQLSDYPQVYGALLQDETTFGKELIKLFNIDTRTVPVFKDVTVNNQDMRVATLIVVATGSSTDATSSKPVSTPTPVITPTPTPTPTPVATTTKVNTTTTTATSTSKTITTATTTKNTSTKATTTTSTSTTKVSTKTATSTKATTTPVEVTPPPVEAPVVPEIIPDANTSFEYVSYGFIGTSTLLISTSQEKLLELRGGIIK